MQFVYESNVTVANRAKTSDNLSYANDFIGLGLAVSMVRREASNVKENWPTNGKTRSSYLCASSGGAGSCLLAAPEMEDHTLGLSMLEICLRELGWEVTWLGGNTPKSSLINAIQAGSYRAVALSASIHYRHPENIDSYVKDLEEVCQEKETLLWLGGSAPWPSPCDYATRMYDFNDLPAARSVL